jgi:hypothetical protein
MEGRMMRCGRDDTINGEVRVLTIVEYSIFGFLLGSTLSGAGLYYYVVDEYRVSNELLSEDVYVSFPRQCEACQHSATNIQLTRWFHTQALQSAVQRLEGYVKGLEQDVKSRK